MASRAHCAKTIYKSLNKYLKWGEQPRCKRIDFSFVTMPKKLLRVYCCCLCLALVPDNLDFFQHFTCLEFLISKVLLSVNKCKFTKAASLTLFPCNQMWKLHPPFWLHDNYTFQQRIVSVSVAGMKQWRHLGKYIIILKNSAIAVFSKSEVCNHNYDQDTLIFTYTNIYLSIYERERAVKNKIK